MKYEKEIRLKDGRTCLLRSGTAADGQAVLENFNQAHGETDFLLSYPDENSFHARQESEFLEKMLCSETGAELLAIVDGRVAGTAGIEAVGSKYKVRHRAEFGISILEEFWHLGIGRALAESCIELARQAGCRQLELEVVADNHRAVALYESLGFREYGRNPRGFLSRTAGYQTLVHMRLEL